MDETRPPKRCWEDVAGAHTWVLVMHCRECGAHQLPTPHVQCDCGTESCLACCSRPTNPPESS